LTATYLLFAAASMRLALRSREVDVPDLRNRAANEASATAGAVGLTVRVDDSRRPDPNIAAGLVVAQEPPPGATARRQRSVRVWLSAGARASEVPVLTGETERAANLRLVSDGLELATLTELQSQAFPPDVVVAQDPPARGPGARVSLLVNRVEAGTGYVMPDLIGVNGDRVVEILRSRGFRVAVVGSLPYPGVAAGIVIRQLPQAGFQIAPGEPISVEVSR
jgi:serine/threonine-protein kinase